MRSFLDTIRSIIEHRMKPFVSCKATPPINPFCIDPPCTRACVASGRAKMTIMLLDCALSGTGILVRTSAKHASHFRERVNFLSCPPFWTLSHSPFSNEATFAYNARQDDNRARRQTEKEPLFELPMKYTITSCTRTRGRVGIHRSPIGST